jgi:16S rRNA processing protein RimM
MGSADQRVCVGRIGAPHGVRGEVRLQSFTADPMAIADYGPLQSQDRKRSLEITSLKPGGKTLLARFKNIGDRRAAEQLRNVALYVSRERLPEPAMEEFYHADLIGLRAQTMDGEALGTIVAIHNFGAGDLLELQPADRSASLLLPFTSTSVPVVDIVGGRIVVVPPDEVFEA